MRSFNVLHFKQFIVLIAVLLVGTSLTQAKITIYSKENLYSNKYRLSHVQIKLFEKDLREKTGLNSLAFNDFGELDYDFWEKAEKGSVKLREAITGAIDDELNVFQIINYSNSRNIHFAQTDAGEIEVNSRITIYKIRFDLADFENAENMSDEEALDSFTLAINLFHEIDHKKSYDLNTPMPKFQIRPEISVGNILGVRENTNYVRSELNLILRDTKERFSKRNNRNIFKIPFVSENGKYKFIRWKNKGI